MPLISSISGIRGTIGGDQGESLTPFEIVKFTGAYGSWVKENSKNPKIVVGRDARVSGEMVLNLVVGTLTSLGLYVIDLGLVPTPTVELAVTNQNADGGIIITASHNPGNWNALKLLNGKGEFISKTEGEKILRNAEKADFKFVETEHIGGCAKNYTLIDKHIDEILELPLINCDAIQKARFKIAVDSVNSVGSLAIPKLLRALEVRQIVGVFDKPDGLFSRVAEPLNENLTELSNVVRKYGLNLGIAVDPDVDRLALIDENGKPLGEEYTLVSVADYVLKKTPGPVVANLSSTKALKDIAAKHNVPFFEAAVGEVNVVEEMKKTDAVIGGEGNGGVIYPDLHYGRDALVGIALFLSHLATSKKKASELRAEYPDYFLLKDKIEFAQNMHMEQVFNKFKVGYPGHEINTIDGVKINFENGWAHLRKSNTEPIVRLYIESRSKKEAEQIRRDLMEIIMA